MGTAVGGRAPPPPAPGSLPAAEARDWSALPWDIVLDIFLRLGPREVMLGAEFACKPWRSVALEETSLWRHIGMESPAVDHWRCRSVSVEMAMKLVAADRAAGQCETFTGHCDDGYLLNLAERAPSLKCLHIDKHYPDYESDDEDLVKADLVEALTKFPLLHELQVYFSYVIDEDRDKTMLQSICEACPLLKELVLMYAASDDLECSEDEYSKERIDGEIPLMRKLRTLKLYECELKGQGLKAILDSCPVLETLHIDGHFYSKREIDKELRAKCARVKNLTLPTRKRSDIYETEEYYSSDSGSEEDYSEDDDSLED